MGYNNLYLIRTIYYLVHTTLYITYLTQYYIFITRQLECVKDLLTNCSVPIPVKTNNHAKFKSTCSIIPRKMIDIYNMFVLLFYLFIISLDIKRSCADTNSNKMTD